MSDSLWTPEIIATIIYRVVMVLVSIVFIWKDYRYVRPNFEEEQLIGFALRRQNIPPAATIGVTSSRRDDQVHAKPAPRLRDHFRANSGNIFASTIGLELDGTYSAATTSATLRATSALYKQSTRNASLEHGLTPTPELSPVHSAIGINTCLRPTANNGLALHGTFPVTKKPGVWRASDPLPSCPSPDRSNAARRRSMTTAWDGRKAWLQPRTSSETF